MLRSSLGRRKGPAPSSLSLAARLQEQFAESRLVGWCVGEAGSIRKSCWPRACFPHLPRRPLFHSSCLHGRTDVPSLQASLISVRITGKLSLQFEMGSTRSVVCISMSILLVNKILGPPEVLQNEIICTGVTRGL